QRQEEVSCSSILFHGLSLLYSNSWQYWIPSIHRFYRKKIAFSIQHRSRVGGRRIKRGGRGFPGRIVPQG
ncbi:unnamed protein product, partial [Musa acuminata subsp. burmannicoides]